MATAQQQKQIRSGEREDVIRFQVTFTFYSLTLVVVAVVVFAMSFDVVTKLPTWHSSKRPKLLPFLWCLE